MMSTPEPTTSGQVQVATMQVMGRVLESSVVLDLMQPAQIVQYSDGAIGVYQRGAAVASWAPGAATLGVERRTTYVRSTPTWAVVLAVLGALFFLLGLLFLLVKENRPVEMSVTTVTIAAGGRIAVAGSPQAIAQ